MNKRKPKPDTSDHTPPHTDAPKRQRRAKQSPVAAPQQGLSVNIRGPRVLVVDPDGTAASMSSLSLTGTIGATCHIAPNLAQARTALAQDQFDVIILSLSVTDGSATDLTRELSEADEPARVILLAPPEARDEDTSDNISLTAMRCGACDLLIQPVTPGALAASVTCASEKAQRIRAQERRLERLKRICRRLNSARQEVTRQVDVLCGDLVSAYQDLADQMSHVSMASEFSSLIRQELDVESLLRTTLEFLLTKTGPTNAAVFLPTGLHDYSLGAYVNYDMPRDNADVLLDHLADSMPARFENEQDIITADTSERLARWIEDDAAWMAAQHVLVFSCRKDGECLGVTALFRDQAKPFTPEIIAQLKLMRDLFAEQLARVVNIHNRHLPKKDWPGFGEAEAGDDYGLAA